MGSDHQDDVDLAIRTAQGDAGAFNEFYARYKVADFHRCQRGPTGPVSLVPPGRLLDLEARSLRASPTCLISEGISQERWMKGDLLEFQGGIIFWGPIEGNKSSWELPALLSNKLAWSDPQFRSPVRCQFQFPVPPVREVRSLRRLKSWNGLSETLPNCARPCRMARFCL